MSSFLQTKVLTELLLDQTGITQAGAVALAFALRENRGLKTLSLHKNELGHLGVIALDGALEVLRLPNPSLQWPRSAMRGRPMLSKCVMLR